MSYTAVIPIQLGTSKTGLTLTGQLYNSNNSVNGASFTSGIYERGNGLYVAVVSVPDAFVGWAEFTATGGIRVAVSLTPQETENADVKTSTRSSHSVADIWAHGTRSLTTFGSLAGEVWSYFSRTITGGSVSGGTIDTNNDKTGYSLSSAGAKGVWDVLLSSLTTVGSVGKQVVDSLDAAISSRTASSVWTNTRANNLDLLDWSIATLKTDMTDRLVEITNKLGPFFGSGGSHVVGFFKALAGTFGGVPNELSTPQEGFDPDVHSLMAIGNRAATNLDVTVSSRLAAVDYEAPGDISALESQLDAIQAKTDTLGAASVTVVAPVADDGDITIIRGDDYAAADGRALEWTDAGNTWPDLTGASIALTARKGGANIEAVGSVVVASGSGKQVRIELASEDTASHNTGQWDFDVEATLASGRRVTLVRGTLTLLSDMTR